MEWKSVFICNNLEKRLRKLRNLSNMNIVYHHYICFKINIFINSNLTWWASTLEVISCKFRAISTIFTWRTFTGVKLILTVPSSEARFAGACVVVFVWCICADTWVVARNDVTKRPQEDFTMPASPAWTTGTTIVANEIYTSAIHITRKLPTLINVTLAVIASEAKWTD